MRGVSCLNCLGGVGPGRRVRQSSLWGGSRHVHLSIHVHTGLQRLPGSRGGLSIWCRRWDIDEQYVFHRQVIGRGSLSLTRRGEGCRVAVCSSLLKFAQGSPQKSASPRGCRDAGFEVIEALGRPAAPQFSWACFPRGRAKPLRGRLRVCRVRRRGSWNGRFRSHAAIILGNCFGFLHVLVTKGYKRGVVRLLVALVGGGLSLSLLRRSSTRYLVSRLQ